MGCGVRRASLSRSASRGTYSTDCRAGAGLLDSLFHGNGITSRHARPATLTVPIHLQLAGLQAPLLPVPSPAAAR